MKKALGAKQVLGVRCKVLGALALGLASTLPAQTPDTQHLTPGTLSDTAQARRVFEANIDAIHKRDRPRYLGYYLQSPSLVRNGPGGLQLGYAPMAAARDTSWPDSLIATHLQLVPVRPGVVYGTYRYRVTQHGVTSLGTSERVFVRTPSGWKIAVSTAFGAPAGTPPPPVVLIGATLIDGTGAAPIPNAVVVIRNGRVACAGTRARCTTAATAATAATVSDTMDLAGKWIIPGLIDAHVHFSQTGWVDGRPDALDRRADFPYDSTVAALERHPERYFRAYLCSGVTGVFDVGGYAWTFGLKGKAEADLEAPHVAVAGPLLSTVDHWINLPDSRQIVFVPDDSVALAMVRANLARGADAIKVWYVVRPNADTTAMKAVVRAAAAETHRLGARLIVHATGLWEAKDALRAGADVLVHGVMNGPVDDEFIQLARDRHVIYTPTLTVGDGYRQVRARRFEPHYPTACVDSTTLAHARATDTIPGGTPGATDRRLDVGVANLGVVHRAGITIAMGTDAGNPLTLHGPSVYWEMAEMQAAGMSAMDVLVASTRNGARAMGRERDLGTLEEGKQADLVVLSADPTADIANVRAVSYVMRGGSLTIPALIRAR